MIELRRKFNNVDVRDYEKQHPDLFTYVKKQMSKPGKQYLLLGDTGHNDRGLRQFLNGPALAALFHRAAIPHVCTELLRELAPPALMGPYQQQIKVHRQEAKTDFWRGFTTNMFDWAGRYKMADGYQALSALNKSIEKTEEIVKSGRLTPEDGQKKQEKRYDKEIGSNTLYFNSWGPALVSGDLRVTAADSFQWRPGFTHDLAERMFLGDRETAAYIRQQSRGEKTAIIYGAAHFLYDGALGTRLERKKCVHIDVYADREEYEASLIDWNVYADVLPDRVYLLKERVLEKPDPALYRSAEARRDDEKQRWKDKVMRRYGSGSDPAAKAAAIAKIIKLPGTDPEYFNYVHP